MLDCGMHMGYNDDVSDTWKWCFQVQVFFTQLDSLISLYTVTCNVINFTSSLCLCSYVLVCFSFQQYAQVRDIINTTEGHYKLGPKVQNIPQELLADHNKFYY